MRSLTAVLLATFFFTIADVLQSKAADQECMIGDAALCLAASPKCHWDAERRGCYPGPAAFRDACAAHKDKEICASSSLGCQWSDANNKCESKAQ